MWLCRVNTLRDMLENNTGAIPCIFRIELLVLGIAMRGMHIIIWSLVIHSPILVNREFDSNQSNNGICTAGLVIFGKGNNLRNF
jgi:hypothetical protein